MNTPSSTITAAALGGAGMTVIWELITLLTMWEPSAVLVSAVTTLVAALIGYYKKENVLKLVKKKVTKIARS